MTLTKVQATFACMHQHNGCVLGCELCQKRSWTHGSRCFQCIHGQRPEAAAKLLLLHSVDKVLTTVMLSCQSTVRANASFVFQAWLSRSTPCESIECEVSCQTFPPTHESPGSLIQEDYDIYVHFTLEYGRVWSTQSRSRRCPEILRGLRLKSFQKELQEHVSVKVQVRQWLKNILNMRQSTQRTCEQSQRISPTKYRFRERQRSLDQMTRLHWRFSSSLTQIIPIVL